MSIWDLLDSLPKRGDVSPEELAARRQGYADLYQGGLLARNSDQEPLSVSTMRSSQDFIPVIGDAIALGEAGQALSRGELAAAGLLGTGALVGLVPGAGDALARPIMAAGRKMADAIPSDAIYAGRSLAEGDMRGVLDAITPGRPAQGLGADAVKPSLPAPRNAAEAAAKDVLELRAAGRASEVTDEMMAAADDQYMYFNTPIDMDVASRMARAEAAGRDRVMYHGGKGGYTELDPDMADGKGYDAGTWLSDEADIAATYAGGVFDNASTYPVVTDTKNFGSVDWRGGNWGDGDPYAYIRNPSGSNNFSDKLSTIYEDWKSWPSSDNAARAANYAGMSGVELKNIVDVGPNIFSRANKGKPLPETSTSFAVFDPSVTRSRFARFDPEFAHLRNLSAGVGGLGLLSQMPLQEEQY